jgi:hypothetical protein
MSKLRVVLSPGGTGQVYLDGEEIDGVCAVEIRGSVGEASEVILTFTCQDVETEIEGVEDVTHGFRVFRNKSLKEARADG